jgi:hypothetical protein
MNLEIGMNWLQAWKAKRELHGAANRPEQDWGALCGADASVAVEGAVLAEITRFSAPPAPGVPVTEAHWAAHRLNGRSVL